MTTTMITVTRGDDIRIILTLTESEQVADVSSASNISAALTSRDGKQSYVQNLDLDANDPDADWANGVVVATFAAADTGDLPAGGVRLEVQVTKSGLKTTWYADSIDSRIGVLA